MGAFLINPGVAAGQSRQKGAPGSVGNRLLPSCNWIHRPGRRERLCKWDMSFHLQGGQSRNSGGLRPRGRGCVAVWVREALLSAAVVGEPPGRSACFRPDKGDAAATIGAGGPGFWNPLASAARSGLLDNANHLDWSANGRGDRPEVCGRSEVLRLPWLNRHDAPMQGISNPLYLRFDLMDSLVKSQEQPTHLLPMFWVVFVSIRASAILLPDNVPAIAKGLSVSQPELLHPLEFDLRVQPRHQIPKAGYALIAEAIFSWGNMVITVAGRHSAAIYARTLMGVLSCCQWSTSKARWCRPFPAGPAATA